MKFYLTNKDGKIRRHPFYLTWVNMRQRCLNKSNNCYNYYGGKGIKICEKWSTIEGFYDDMWKSYLKHKKKNKSTTIDRIDANGDYCPENCRWATRKVQSQSRDFCRKVTYLGKTQSIGKWIDELGLKIKPKNLYKRIYDRKWSVDRAMTTPCG